MKNLTSEQWANSLEKDNNAQILDVRTEDEFIEGYIPGAKNIDIYKGQGFLDAINELDKNKNYYVYCRSGARSAQACALMGQNGLNNTYNLLGGISEWEGEIENSLSL
ncbi:MAG: rhodanese-like domain-containing protein [Gillisia sp.]